MTETKKYYENDLNSVAKTEQDFLVKSYNKQRAKSFFHKLGNSLGLVVVTLPLAGLLAAIGGIIMSKGTNEAAYTAGLVLADLGQSVLSNLGLLFMLAIIIGFTGNKGMAVYVGIIGYIAFVGFSIPFIRYTPATSGDDLNNVMNSTEFNIWFWKGLSVNTQLADVMGLGQGAVNFNSDNANEFARMSYKGVKTLNTGVLGGITLGFVYAAIYNRFKDLKLPTMLAFFEGEKFVALLCITLAPVIAAAYIIVWPAINYGLEYIGIGLSYLPYGIDAFFEGMMTRILLPFESHPAFYGPLWWTSAGGSLDLDNARKIAETMMYRISEGKTVGIGQEMNFYNDNVLPWAKSVGLDEVVKNLDLKGLFLQTSYTDLFAQGHINNVTTINESLDSYAKIKWGSTSGDQLMTMELLNNNPDFDMRDAWGINLKVTRFISGGYGMLMFIIPTIGFAMWSTLDKETRTKKFGLYFGAILTSFLLGITEPIEFMFAFTAPVIYFFMYAPFYGLFFGLATLFQVKLGSTFSQGLVDYIVNAIIPTVTRGESGVAQTNIWVPLVIGPIGALIAFPLFRWIFIKFEFAAPGSKAAELGTGVSTSTYTRIKKDYDGLVSYFGGVQNIESVEVKGSNKVAVQVIRPDRVVNNEFTESTMNKSTQTNSQFIVELKPQKDGMEYIEFLKDMINVINKGEDFKAAKKAEKAQFKATLKEAKANGTDTTELVAKRKAEIKQFNIEKSRFEKVNKINAKWELKENELLNTTDIEKLKYDFKMDRWAKKHLQDKELLKANYVADMKLADSDKKQSIKDKYNSDLEKLTFDKQALKDDKVAYKATLKELKLAKKEEFAKDRTSLVSKIKARKANK